MIAKIEIEIDTEKKGITNIVLPPEINPIEVSIILNSVQTKLLSSVSIEPKSKIITPDKNIKLV